MLAVNAPTLSIENVLRFLPDANLYLLPDAPHFTILDFSETYRTVTLTEREEVIGKGVFEAFPENPDDPSADGVANLKNSLMKVLKEKVPHEMPVQRYDVRNKESGWFETKYWRPKNAPVLDNDGNVILIIQTVQDVTSRILSEQNEKQARAILNSTEQHYFSLFQQNPDAVFSFDLEGNFLSANNALATLAECTLDELYQKSFIPFVAPEDLDRTQFHFNEAGRGIPQCYDVKMITAKGNYRILNVTNLPIVVNTKTVGVYGIAKDITVLADTRQELVKSNKQFEMVSRVSNDAIWDWNLLTNDVTRAGSNFYNLFGYSLMASPLTEFWISLIHPDDVERVLTRFKEALKNPEIKMLQETYRVLKADKSYAYILDRGYIDRDENGRAIHIYGATKDITDRKKSEAEREDLIKELTQINLDLKQFSYITSHNLRTPIGNLISLGNLIDETKIEDPMTRMLFEKYKETALKLNDNVNDLLEILVIKNNREVPKKEITIDFVFNQVMESVETYVAASNAAISTDFSAGNSVNFNPGYLHSILLNLLTNAIKYRSVERPLQITVNTEKSNDYLLLHFTDNGLGLDLEKYGDRIFGLYQKFHDHPESKGLGLHIIASQVKAMGGEITVKSQVNIGTTFTIQFNNQL